MKRIDWSFTWGEQLTLVISSGICSVSPGAASNIRMSPFAPPAPHNIPACWKGSIGICSLIFPICFLLSDATMELISTTTQILAHTLIRQGHRILRHTLRETEARTAWLHLIEWPMHNVSLFDCLRQETK